MYHKPLSLESYLSLSAECMSGPMGLSPPPYLSFSLPPSPPLSVLHTRKTIPHFPAVKVTSCRCLPVTKYFYLSMKPRAPTTILRGLGIINNLNMHETICISIQVQQYGSHLLRHLERVGWADGREEERTWLFACKDFSDCDSHRWSSIEILLNVWWANLLSFSGGLSSGLSSFL